MEDVPEFIRRYAAECGYEEFVTKPGEEGEISFIQVDRIEYPIDKDVILKRIVSDGTSIAILTDLICTHIFTYNESEINEVSELPDNRFEHESDNGMLRGEALENALRAVSKFIDVPTFGPEGFAALVLVAEHIDRDDQWDMLAERGFPIWTNYCQKTVVEFPQFMQSLAYISDPEFYDRISVFLPKFKDAQLSKPSVHLASSYIGTAFNHRNQARFFRPDVNIALRHVINRRTAYLSFDAACVLADGTVSGLHSSWDKGYLHQTMFSDDGLQINTLDVYGTKGLLFDLIRHLCGEGDQRSGEEDWDLEGLYDTIICVPPIPMMRSDRDQTTSRLSDRDIIEDVLDHLSPDGRAYLLLSPKSLQSNKYAEIRSKIVSKYNLEAIITVKKPSIVTSIPMVLLIVCNGTRGGTCVYGKKEFDVDELAYMDLMSPSSLVGADGFETIQSGELGDDWRPEVLEFRRTAVQFHGEPISTYCQVFVGSLSHRRTLPETSFIGIPYLTRSDFNNCKEVYQLKRVISEGISVVTRPGDVLFLDANPRYTISVIRDQRMAIGFPILLFRPNPGVDPHQLEASLSEGDFVNQLRRLILDSPMSLKATAVGKLMVKMRRM